MNSIDLLARLIAFPTVSRDSNAALIAFVGDFLAERGVEALVLPSEDGAKASLYATIGPRDRPGILLSGHTDVVPVDGQDWNMAPFRLTQGEGRLYGRGTADMKGFIACALHAADLAAGRALKTPLHLALSYDEEIGCVGVRPLIARLAQMPVRPRLAIIGEPTSMRIATGHKGKIAARAVCCGVEAHSALAPSGLNALHLACDFVGVLRETQARLQETGARDEDYDVPYSTVHVGLMSGGVALNIVPSKASVDFEIRTLAADDAGAILAGIAARAGAIAAAERGRFPKSAIAVETVNAYPGLGEPETSEAVALLRRITGGNGLTKIAFGTEGGLFSRDLGLPVAICGPGSMDQGHKPDEFVTQDDLAACDRMMERLLGELAA